MNLVLPCLMSLIFCVVQVAGNDEIKTEYLELRTLNYRYVQRYKDYLKARSEGLLEESLQAEREFRKAWAEYLKKLPDPAIIQDPNGYYSKPDRLGFNPLESKPLNSVFKDFPILHGVANPKIFTDTDKSNPAPLNLEPSSSEKPLGMELNLFPDGSLTELEYGTKGKSQGKKGNAPGIQKKNQAERLARGRDLLKSSTQSIGAMVKDYTRQLNESNPDLSKILALREYISTSLGRLHQLDGTIGRLKKQSNGKGENPGAPVGEVQEDQATKAELYKITEEFQALVQQKPNPFTLLTAEQLEPLFLKPNSEYENDQGENE